MNQTLWLYGIIGDEVDGLTGKSIRDELKKANPNGRLLVRINSPGGLVYEAIAIHTQLVQWPGTVDVQVDGIAASAASYLATVGQTVSIARDGMMMIHDAWSATVGNAADHQKAAHTLDTISEQIVTAYVAKSGRSREEVRAAMRAETWFTSQGCVEFGLADVRLGDDGKAKMSPRERLAEMQRMLEDAKTVAGVL